MEESRVFRVSISGSRTKEMPEAGSRTAVTLASAALRYNRLGFQEATTWVGIDIRRFASGR